MEKVRRREDIGQDGGAYILAQSKEDIMNVIAVHANMFKI